MLHGRRFHAFIFLFALTISGSGFAMEQTDLKNEPDPKEELFKALESIEKYGAEQWKLRHIRNLLESSEMDAASIEKAKARLKQSYRGNVWQRRLTMAKKYTLWGAYIGSCVASLVGAEIVGRYRLKYEILPPEPFEVFDWNSIAISIGLSFTIIPAMGVVWGGGLLGATHGSKRLDYLASKYASIMSAQQEITKELNKKVPAEPKNLDNVPAEHEDLGHEKVD